LKIVIKEWQILKKTLISANIDLGVYKRCQILVKYGLPYKYHLRTFKAGMPIPKSLIHPRYWLKGLTTHQPNWQPRYSGEEPMAHIIPEIREIKPTGQQISEIHAQLQVEEKARFEHQYEAGQQKLLAIAKQHLEL
jgi:hypothetical protein